MRSADIDWSLQMAKIFKDTEEDEDLLLKYPLSDFESQLHDWSSFSSSLNTSYALKGWINLNIRKTKNDSNFFKIDVVLQDTIILVILYK